MAAVLGLELHQRRALDELLGFGLVGVAEIDPLGDQIGIVPLGDFAGDIRFAVQAHVVGKNDHAVLGDGNISLHHRAGIDAVGVVEGLQRVVGEFLVAAAVGDQDGQLALLAHGVGLGKVLRAGQQETHQPDDEQAQQCSADALQELLQQLHNGTSFPLHLLENEEYLSIIGFLRSSVKVERKQTICISKKIQVLRSIRREC